jgi:uncharacterized protein Usg
LVKGCKTFRCTDIRPDALVVRAQTFPLIDRFVKKWREGLSGPAWDVVKHMAIIDADP